MSSTTVLVTVKQVCNLRVKYSSVSYCKFTGRSDIKMLSRVLLLVVLNIRVTNNLWALTAQNYNVHYRQVICFYSNVYWPYFAMISELSLTIKVGTYITS